MTWSNNSNDGTERRIMEDRFDCQYSLKIAEDTDLKNLAAPSAMRVQRLGHLAKGPWINMYLHLSKPAEVTCYTDADHLADSESQRFANSIGQRHVVVPRWTTQNPRRAAARRHR